MAPVDIWFLVLGIIAAIVNISSYQIKREKTYLIFQVCMAAILVVQYGLIGAWAAVILNSISTLRALTFYFNKNNKERNRILGIIFIILNVAAIIISCTVFKEYWYMGLVIGVAQIVGTIAMATDDNKIVKIAQLFIVSPCWLAYATFYTCIGHPNYGGIVMEAMNMVSIIVFFIRIKLEKKNNQTEAEK